ncbi:MAG: hypothetical protein QF685_07750 [Verrucomicrobiota bacterium]|nr:hypothetical protein [Verrucomicrobiota bacterium]
MKSKKWIITSLPSIILSIFISSGCAVIQEFAATPEPEDKGPADWLPELKRGDNVEHRYPRESRWRAVVVRDWTQGSGKVRVKLTYNNTSADVSREKLIKVNRSIEKPKADPRVYRNANTVRSPNGKYVAKREGRTWKVWGSYSSEPILTLDTDFTLGNGSPLVVSGFGRPVWSPNSKFIASIGSATGRGNYLVVWNLDSSMPVGLRKSQTWKWSPDSSHLILGGKSVWNVGEEARQWRERENERRRALEEMRKRFPIDPARTSP